MFGGIAALDAERFVFAGLEGTVTTFHADGEGVSGHFALPPMGPRLARFTACAAAGGDPWVADARNSCIRRFRADGLPLARAGARRNPGMRVHDDGGVLEEPYALLERRGSLFVACGESDLLHGVQKFDARGRYETSFPCGGRSKTPWRQPRGIAAIGGALWIAEAGSGLLRVHAMDGRHQADLELPQGFGRPLRLADDGYGGVLLVLAGEPDAPAVVRLDGEGEVVSPAVLQGSAAGEASSAFDLAVLPDGRFLVADLPSGVPEEARIQLFSADARLLRVLVEDAGDLRAQVEAHGARLMAGGGSAFEQARALHQFVAGGEPERARALYLEAIREEPRHLMAWVGLGALLRERLADPEAAERAFRSAIEAGGSEGDLLALVAECRRDLGDLDGAIAILKDAVDRPGGPELHHERVEELADWFLERAGEAPEGEE
ncbi:MAG: hypothetical protein ACT4PV_12380 [Planctomycetaceae bacterium]